jgi:hypothetical protein
MEKSTKTLAVSIPQWIIKDVIGISSNRSQRVQELLIKGKMFEEKQKFENKNDNGITGIQSWDLNKFGRFPSFVT